MTVIGITVVFTQAFPAASMCVVCTYRGGLSTGPRAVIYKNPKMIVRGGRF